MQLSLSISQGVSQFTFKIRLLLFVFGQPVKEDKGLKERIRTKKVKGVEAILKFFSLDELVVILGQLDESSGRKLCLQVSIVSFPEFSCRPLSGSDFDHFKAGNRYLRQFLLMTLAGGGRSASCFIWFLGVCWILLKVLLWFRGDQMQGR